jgi:hypothetical protein
VTWDKTETPAGRTGHRGASDADLQLEIPPATAVLIGSLT